MDSQSPISDRLNALPSILRPIAEFARRLTDPQSHLDAHGNLRIGHRPETGPKCFCVTIFAPAKPGWLRKFEHRTGQSIPLPVEIFLHQMNGAHLNSLSLYGLPPSMMEDPPSLDRSLVQPLDLQEANSTWNREYMRADGLFFFGSRHYLANENLGYFIDRADRFIAIRRNGDRIGTWRDLTSFLVDEIAAAEAYVQQRKT